jgi:N-acetyl-gamma-glutamyl-phosphate reductase
MYVSVPQGVSEADVRQLYCTTYAGEPFVQVLPAEQLATVRHVANSNRCAISITPANPHEADGPDYIIVAAIDNLVKGASGQAIQCYNVAAGLPETMGLI